MEKIYVTPYILCNNEKTKSIKAAYDEIIYPAIEKTPPKFAIIKRNKWLIDNSNLLIACVKYSWGGAAKTLEYAKKKKIKIINIS